MLKVAQRVQSRASARSSATPRVDPRPNQALRNDAVHGSSKQLVALLPRASNRLRDTHARRRILPRPHSDKTAAYKIVVTPPPAASPQRRGSPSPALRQAITDLHKGVSRQSELLRSRGSGLRRVTGGATRRSSSGFDPGLFDELRDLRKLVWDLAQRTEVVSNNAVYNQLADVKHMVRNLEREVRRGRASGTEQVFRDELALLKFFVRDHLPQKPNDSPVQPRSTPDAINFTPTFFGGKHANMFKRDKSAPYVAQHDSDSDAPPGSRSSGAVMWRESTERRSQHRGRTIATKTASNLPDQDRSGATHHLGENVPKGEHYLLSRKNVPEWERDLLGGENIPEWERDLLGAAYHQSKDADPPVVENVGKQQKPGDDVNSKLRELLSKKSHARAVDPNMVPILDKLLDPQTRVSPTLESRRLVDPVLLRLLEDKFNTTNGIDPTLLHLVKKQLASTPSTDPALLYGLDKLQRHTAPGVDLPLLHILEDKLTCTKGVDPTLLQLLKEQLAATPNTDPALVRKVQKLTTEAAPSVDPTLFQLLERALECGRSVDPALLQLLEKKLYTGTGVNPTQLHPLTKQLASTPKTPSALWHDVDQTAGGIGPSLFQVQKKPRESTTGADLTVGCQLGSKLESHRPVDDIIALKNFAHHPIDRSSTSPEDDSLAREALDSLKADLAYRQDYPRHPPLRHDLRDDRCDLGVRHHSAVQHGNIAKFLTLSPADLADMRPRASGLGVDGSRTSPRSGNDQRRVFEQTVGRRSKRDAPSPSNLLQARNPRQRLFALHKVVHVCNKLATLQDLVKDTLGDFERCNASPERRAAGIAALKNLVNDHLERLPSLAKDDPRVRDDIATMHALLEGRASPRSPGDADATKRLYDFLAPLEPRDDNHGDAAQWMPPVVLSSNGGNFLRRLEEKEHEKHRRLPRQRVKQTGPRRRYSKESIKGMTAWLDQTPAELGGDSDTVEEPLDLNWTFIDKAALAHQDKMEAEDASSSSALNASVIHDDDDSGSEGADSIVFYEPPPTKDGARFGFPQLPITTPPFKDLENGKGHLRRKILDEALQRDHKKIGEVQRNAQDALSIHALVSGTDRPFLPAHLNTPRMTDREWDQIFVQSSTVPKIQFWAEDESPKAELPLSGTSAKLVSIMSRLQQDRENERIRVEQRRKADADTRMTRILEEMMPSKLHNLWVAAYPEGKFENTHKQVLHKKESDAVRGAFVGKTHFEQIAPSGANAIGGGATWERSR